MHTRRFSGTPEFHNIPIELKRLATTGKNEGNDEGYRKVKIQDTGEELVDLGDAVMRRPQYEGIDAVTGAHTPELILPAGTERAVYARRSVLEALKAANNYLASRYPGMQIGVVDAFRSKRRQALGFSKKTIEVLQGNKTPDIPTLYKAGIVADGTFSLVRAVRRSPIYKEFVKDMAITTEVIHLAQELGKNPHTVAAELADVCANLRTASEAFSHAPDTPLSMHIPLDANNNAHAGGGAVDAFLYDANGRPLNMPVPYDYIGPEAAMDYLEQPESLDAFRQQVNQNPVLQEHLRKQGIVGEVSEEQWNSWKESQRIMYHTMKGLGSTIFSDTAKNAHSSKFFGGENWHFEPGNVVYDPGTGKPIYEGPSSAFVRDGGNAGHTLQKKGRGVKAPWGGNAAQKQLKQKGILEEE